MICGFGLRFLGDSFVVFLVGLIPALFPDAGQACGYTALPYPEGSSW